MKSKILALLFSLIVFFTLTGSAFAKSCSKDCCGCSKGCDCCCVKK